MLPLHAVLPSGEARSWIKCHDPAVWSGERLNWLPMGYYLPPQLAGDARQHGIEVRPVDVRHSDWDCTLEGDALRLGMRLVSGLREDAARRIVAARAQAPLRDLDDLLHRADLDHGSLDRLAEARSEEHTSELQSLMRISYAVFCLKKKKKTTT